MNKFSKTFFVILFVLGTGSCIAQPRARIDERFELTGVVFSLIEEDAYRQLCSVNYLNDIEEYFAKYKNHELIQFVNQKINDNFYLDFPCTLAADIEITPKGIVFTHQWTTYYDDYTVYSDVETWTKTEMDEYLRLLNKFYKDTKFHRFFVSHKDFYSAAEDAYQEIINKIDTAWFLNFFGKPYAMENIWIVPALGGNNFGFRRIDSSGKEYNNCIISCTQINEKGKPFFNTNDFKLLIHESCHNYTQPLWEKYYKQCEDICDTIYSFLGDILVENHYGSPSSTIFEGMNRLYEYCYYKDHNTLENEFFTLDCSLKDAASQGFPWLIEAMTFMDNFDKNRNVYENCEAFVPDLIQFLHNVARNMAEYYYPKIHELAPLIINTFPAQNSVVNTNIGTIMFKFSQPIKSILEFEDVNGNLSWDDVNFSMTDENTHCLTLKGPLKPHTQYKIVIYGLTESCHCTTRDFKLFFETK